MAISNPDGCCGGTVQTDCCPNNPIPETLTFNWESNCNCAGGSGSFPIAHQGDGVWFGEGNFGACVESGTQVAISTEVRCTPIEPGVGVWELAWVVVGPCLIDQTPQPFDSASCEPLELKTTRQFGSCEENCGVPAANFSIRITV